MYNYLRIEWTGQKCIFFFLFLSGWFIEANGRGFERLRTRKKETKLVFHMTAIIRRRKMFKIHDREIIKRVCAKQSNGGFFVLFLFCSNCLHIFVVVVRLADEMIGTKMNETLDMGQPISFVWGNFPIIRRVEKNTYKTTYTMKYAYTWLMRIDSNSMIDVDFSYDDLYIVYIWPSNRIISPLEKDIKYNDRWNWLCWYGNQLECCITFQMHVYIV